MGPRSRARHTMKASNRRNHHRASLGKRVQYYCNQRLFTNQASNISEGGLCLEGTVTALRVGDILKLFITLPPNGTRRRDKLCLLQGQVVWRGDDRVGIQFIDPPLESMLEVRSFVQLAA